jgi:uncharacterized protein (DUF1800 family)
MQRKKKEVDRSLAKYFYPLTLGAALAVSALPRIAAAQDDVTPEDAIRFLEQSSFGANWTEIQRVQQLGYAGYLQDQFNQPPSGWNDLGLCPTTPQAPCTPTRDYYTMYQTQNQFYQKALASSDQLRQRVVFALDQMWVISAQWTGNFQAAWMNYYLMILENDAFGNWRQLMQDITLSPGMGKYLDMSGNFFVAGRAANENYAREIMQLFNVGLDELNDDGTPILDGDGNRIPTYTQDVVVGFSKVFTGWRLQADVPAFTAPCNSTTTGQNCPNWRDPMMPVSPNTNHDHTDKFLLAENFGEDNVVLPARPESDPSCADAGGCVYQDLSDGLDNIFYNHNVPVYVCSNFIKYLVTSNPSGQYVSNCVAAFKNNGAGVRGDMQAVLAAILLDPEARTAPDPSVNPYYGKLREPVLAMTNILRNFNVDGRPCSTTGNPCTDFVLGETLAPAGGPSIPYRMDEPIFQSPTVFNFFPPGFVITNPDSTQMFAPEFAILSTTTELARMNLMNALVCPGSATVCNYTQGIAPGADRPYGTRIDPAEMVAYYAGDDGGLVDGLNQIMMHGTMSSDMRTLLVNEISGVADPNAKAQKAVYLIAISSSYNVQR